LISTTSVPEAALPGRGVALGYGCAGGIDQVYEDEEIVLERLLDAPEGAQAQPAGRAVGPAEGDAGQVCAADIGAIELGRRIARGQASCVDRQPRPKHVARGCAAELGQRPAGQVHIGRRDRPLAPGL
jgi:hypothetical protein